MSSTDFGGPERRAPLRLNDRRQEERRLQELLLRLTADNLVLCAQAWRAAWPLGDREAQALVEAVDAYQSAQAAALARAEAESGRVRLDLLCWLGAGALALVPTTMLGAGTWPRLLAALLAVQLLVAGAVANQAAHRRRRSPR